MIPKAGKGLELNGGERRQSARVTSLIGALSKAKWVLCNIGALSRDFLDIVASIFGLTLVENMMLLRVFEFQGHLVRHSLVISSSSRSLHAIYDTLLATQPPKYRGLLKP